MLHARDLGDGPPVVCLHPGPGLDGSVFLPEFRRIADAGFRVLLCDLPGNGESPATDWTLDAFARAVEDFAHERDLRDWTLLGHSFGGFVAMHHLARHGTAARYIASGTLGWEPEDEEELDPVAGLPPDVAATVRDAFTREKHVKTPEDCRQVWHDQAPLFMAGDPGPLRRRLAAVRFSVEAHHEHDWGELDAREALASYPGRVLAIAGEQDRDLPPRLTRPIADQAAHGTFVEVPGTGHFPWMEDPDGYLQPLITWLREAP